ncbi:MAG: hypothetical protein K0R55_296 [Sporomusa sp.]|nr:hypothetical protein [Sporomusa sp.]
MVTRIVPVQRVDLRNRNPYGATDGIKKKVQYSKSFKEVLTKQLAVAGKNSESKI